MCYSFDNLVISIAPTNSMHASLFDGLAIYLMSIMASIYCLLRASNG